ncbi:MAG: hypothetical protein ABSF55_01985 [Candidatus Staskawiczbacteria bacterium]|jgi:hypothetical protein
MMRAWFFGEEIGNPIAKWVFIVLLGLFAVIVLVATSPLTIPLHFILKACGREGLIHSAEGEYAWRREQNPQFGFRFKRN